MGFGESVEGGLMRHLVADHTHLDIKEDTQVWGEVWREGAMMLI